SKFAWTYRSQPKMVARFWANGRKCGKTRWAPRKRVPYLRRGRMSGNDAVSLARGFRAQRRESEDCTVVECFGRLTSENVPLLKDTMREACAKKGRIVLDLKEVPMMDSSGLG